MFIEHSKNVQLDVWQDTESRFDNEWMVKALISLPDQPNKQVTVFTTVRCAASEVRSRALLSVSYTLGQSFAELVKIDDSYNEPIPPPVPEPAAEAPPKITRRPWTRAENKKLLSMYFDNKSYDEIGQALNRTSNSCRIQVSLLLRQK